ncbi:ABC transporter permease [Brevibacillus sp. H7]|uniref:ABC transporter permease n=1 Tax=Brevibacillus sp. H7 TaxID=3349138 RepID=UPI0038144A82
MVYWRIIQKSYRRNLQYRLSHFINNIASSIFGLVFIAIWAGVLEGREADSPYSMETMGHYITLSQCVLWVSTFLTPGLGIQTGVRSGAVSLDLMRPVHYFLYVISHELGKVGYNALYRSIPIGGVLGLFVGFSFPDQPVTYLLASLSLLLAVYLGLLLFFLTGITSFWTTEIRWAHYIVITLIFGLGGQMIPVNLLPGWLGEIAPYLPFAGVLYYPVMIYLEQVSPSGLLIQLGWGLALTIAALAVTQKARRKIEIQGG